MEMLSNSRKQLRNWAATVWGEDEASRTLYLCFPGTVRVDVVSTHRAEYPKPGKPVYHAASIQEDLRRRDFTVNAMAISLNEGSFGLLMDPLNGAADIESRTLRLVSNYGFLEEPSLLIRATRYRARLGWELDPKTRTRYENAKGEGVIEHLSAAGAQPGTGADRPRRRGAEGAAGAGGRGLDEGPVPGLDLGQGRRREAEGAARSGRRAAARRAFMPICRRRRCSC